MKKVSTVITILLFAALTLFSNLGKSIELSDLDNVSGIAIDFQNGKFSVTCELVLPSENDPYASKTKYVKGEGFTISEALENASDNTDKKLYTDSVRLYVISDALKSDAQVKSYFMSGKVNLRAVCVYCEGTAAKILDTERTDSAKSVLLSDKIKRLCFEIKKPVPKPIKLLKNTLSVYITKDGRPERSDNEIK